MNCLPIWRNFVVASAGGSMRAIFDAAIGGDLMAQRIILASLPAQLPPSARRRLRDTRLVELAAAVWDVCPGMRPYAVADILCAAGRRIEAGQNLDHPAFAAISEVPPEFEGAIRAVLEFLPRNASSDRKWPDADTIFAVIK